MALFISQSEQKVQNDQIIESEPTPVEEENCEDSIQQNMHWKNSSNRLKSLSGDFNTKKEKKLSFGNKNFEQLGNQLTNVITDSNLSAEEQFVLYLKPTESGLGTESLAIEASQKNQGKRQKSRGSKASKGQSGDYKKQTNTQNHHGENGDQNHPEFLLHNFNKQIEK